MSTEIQNPFQFPAQGPLSHASATARFDKETCFLTNSLEEDDEDDEDNELSEPGDDEDEEKFIKQKAYDKYLPGLKRLVEELCGNERPNMSADREEKCCAVCPTKQRFKGWKALLAHAQTFKKKRIQQHRGYHEALREALRLNENYQDERGLQTRAASINPEATKGHLIVWPPVMLVETVDAGSIDLRTRVQAFLRAEFPQLHETECLPSSQTSCLVAFKAEAIGYLEAQRVDKWFTKHRRGRDDKQWCKRENRSPILSSPVDEDKQPCLFAFLATLEDMNYRDPERKLLRWSQEGYYERVQHAQKKVIEEHDNKQAELKEMEQKVENLAEDELKFKINKQHIEHLIGQKQEEIANHKRRAEDIEQRYLDAVHTLHASFQKDMKNFEARSTVKVKKLREELEQNEIRLEEERTARTKEIESLQKQFQVLTEDIKQKETQKALERELDVMQKKKNFMADMARAEAYFNKQAREQESILQEKQHHEMMQLLEEAKEERVKLLKEWLKEQEVLKKQGEAKDLPGNESTQQAFECAVCMDPLNEDNRALLRPCGHAKMCMKCAIGVLKNSGTCPFCREKIDKKPMLLPKKLYM